MEVEIGGQRGEGMVGVRGRPESGDSSSGLGTQGRWPLQEVCRLWQGGPGGNFRVLDIWTEVPVEQL